GCAAPGEAQFPIRYDVSFEGDIRPLLESSEQNCTTCHGASGGLSFSAAGVKDALLGPDERGRAAQHEDAMGLLRVRPHEPYASALLLKIACEVAPFGATMPLGGSADPELVALIHDWIAAGALMPDTFGGERLFIGGFERIARPEP